MRPWRRSDDLERTARHLDHGVDLAGLAVTAAHPTARAARRRTTRRRRPPARRAVGPAEGVGGVVEGDGMALVAHRPLLERRLAVVVGPQPLGADPQAARGSGTSTSATWSSGSPWRTSTLQYQARALDRQQREPREGADGRRPSRASNT